MESTLWPPTVSPYSCEDSSSQDLYCVSSASSQQRQEPLPRPAWTV